MPRRRATKELIDQVLEDEIASLADVMEAAANADGPMSQDEVDDALGVAPEQDDDHQP